MNNDIACYNEKNYENLSEEVSDFETFGKMDVDLDYVISEIKKRIKNLDKIENDDVIYNEIREVSGIMKNQLQWVLSFFGE